MPPEYGRNHPTTAPGFATHQDPFASISQNRGAYDDEDAIDFEDTYDGLGDGLDEADDNLNDDTFGGGEAKPAARDFDFFGSTNKVTGAINEEAARFQRQSRPAFQAPLATHAAPSAASKPYRSGYEAYKKPGYKPDLQVDQSLWETGHATTQPQIAPRPSTQHTQSPVPDVAPSRKMMSLEEVEASMQSLSKKPTAAYATQQSHSQEAAFPVAGLAERPFGSRQQEDHTAPSDQRHVRPNIPRQSEIPSSKQEADPYQQYYDSRLSLGGQRPIQAEASPKDIIEPEALSRNTGNVLHDKTQPQPPRQILQNPNRHSGSSRPIAHDPHTRHDVRKPAAPQARGDNKLPIITHPSQLAGLPEEQRQALLAEDAKRAKRNHKIYVLSKGNGLMTPQDKNFITRIQLQQLMTATGNVHEQDSDTVLAEDFYYQVYNQIESRPRQNPNQPLGNFAQTYLFQTGNRQGGFNRRHNRGDNHMHRMQQQVQRAVEAAKAKPKNKQLVIEGSLGKISFSNAKTPKPLLNIKRNDRLPQATLNATDRKAILKNIEAVYSSLMTMEDHDRRMPPRPSQQSDPALSEPYDQWRGKFKKLNDKLWFDLKVMEPIVPDSTVMHPFMAFLSYPKGKKAIPRVFSHIDKEQRLTVVTIIMIQLDSLDVVRSAQPSENRKHDPSIVNEQVDLFLQTVMPSLFSCVTEAPLSIIIGLVGLIIERVNVTAVARSRVGLEILTMLLSQAEIIRKAEATDAEEWKQWLGVYNRLFNTIEPLLPTIFPGSISTSQDVYVWQFLATIGTGANPEQQQRLVLAVKDRVMDTVHHCKTLPPDMALRRRGDVNLFMQAIGLDVDLLDN